MRALQIVRRIVQRLLATVALLLVAAILAGGAAAYLTGRGSSLTFLKVVVTRLGILFDGQRTENLTIDADLSPDNHRLDAHARLTLRSSGAARQRFYFLLNPGLTIRRAQVAKRAAPRVYQLWMVTVVDVGQPVAVNDTVELDLDYDGDPTASGLGASDALCDARDVLLPVDQFWYPNDVQSFFNADVTVTLPARFTLVHNGHELSRADHGDRQRVHWRSERPLAGMALVAGSYQRTAATIASPDVAAVQLFTADDVALDSPLVLHDAADANATLTRRFGPSSFPQLTTFVTRRLRRAFNDGSGLMGVPLRSFRRGDYGLHTVAHEIAHNWWGSTVAEKWLTPGSGGEWIVEGFAEYSSLLVSEERWGRDALTRRMAEEFFDPARQGVVASMSVLDNAFAEASARDTIYKKGAYIAMMLRTALGDQVMEAALRQFIERFRYRQASDVDLEAVVKESSGQDVASFFADWVRSDKLADLTLEPSGTNQVDVANRGEAMVAGTLPLWVLSDGAAAPEQHAVRVGETVALPSAGAIAILDPQLTWADMLRFNNRTPRLAAPRFVTTSARGEVLITSGEPNPGAPATLALRTADGKPIHSWEFERGVVEAPVFSIDGSRIVVSSLEATGEWPAIIALNGVDGSRSVIGNGSNPAFGRNGSIIATNGERLLRFDEHGRQTLRRHRGQRIDSSMPSPSGRWIAYVAARGSRIDLRVCDDTGATDRSLLTWDRDRVLLRWAADESRLYAVMGGNWDWQIWDIPLDQAPVRVLVRDAAAIRDLAISPDGSQLAFTAAPSLSRPLLSHQLFALDLKSGRARVLDADHDVRQLAWEGGDALLAITGSSETPVAIPEPRALRRFHLSNGSSEAVDIKQ